MEAALRIASIIAALTPVIALPTTSQTPNPVHGLAKRDVHFPEGCDVVCDWDGDKPELPECTWDLCMDNIKKSTCDQAEIASVDDNSDAARWNSVYSMFLFENLTISYREDNKKRLPYVPYISDQLHGTENMVCGTLAEHSGCNAFYQCDDTKYPGGYFILNSFVTINNLFRNFYEGVQHARGEIQTAIPALGSTFSPVAEEGLSTAVIIDLVTMGYLGAAAPFWNSIAKKLPYFRQRDVESGDWRSVNANTHGTLKDFINGMVTSSLTLAKDLTAAQAENAVDREMSKLLGALISAYSEVIDGTAKTIFNGERSSTQWLYRMFQDGKFISSLDLTLSTEEIKKMVALPIYAQLIPRAWRLSNLPVAPFILDTGLDCNDDGSLKNSADRTRIEVSDETLAKNGYCDEGKLFVLTSTPDHNKHCQQTGDDGSCFADFQQLPGANELDGKAWAGLTPKDITRAAVNTWKSNGKNNDGGTLDVDTEFQNLADNYGDLDSDDIVDRILDSGIHTAGLIMLPVCDGFDARANWARAYNSFGNNFHPWNKYPCDD